VSLTLAGLQVVHAEDYPRGDATDSPLRGYCARYPPSTGSTAPVMNEASSSEVAERQGKPATTEGSYPATGEV
jgi:hypothetical protein